MALNAEAMGAGTPLAGDEAALQRRLGEMVRQSAWFMPALLAVRALALPPWCIGAGAVRNLVWDTLHGHAEPSPLADIDVVYFDRSDASAQRDAALQHQLLQAHPDLPWEVTNQAGVHHWFEAHFGHAVEPLQSLEDAVASWPEYATAVGVSLDEGGGVRVIAPFGLQDLFGLVVRRNPRRVSLETYRQRVEQKAYARRWPRVRVIGA